MTIPPQIDLADQWRKTFEESESVLQRQIEVRFPGRKLYDYISLKKKSSYSLIIEFADDLPADLLAVIADVFVKSRPVYTRPNRTNG